MMFLNNPIPDNLASKDITHAQWKSYWWIRAFDIVLYIAFVLAIITVAWLETNLIIHTKSNLNPFSFYVWLGLTIFILYSQEILENQKWLRIEAGIIALGILILLLASVGLGIVMLVKLKVDFLWILVWLVLSFVFVWSIDMARVGLYYRKQKDYTYESWLKRFNEFKPGSRERRRELVMVVIINCILIGLALIQTNLILSFQQFGDFLYFLLWLAFSFLFFVIAVLVEEALHFKYLMRPSGVTMGLYVPQVTQDESES